SAASSSSAPRSNAPPARSERAQADSPRANHFDEEAWAAMTFEQQVAALDESELHATLYDAFANRRKKWKRTQLEAVCDRLNIVKGQHRQMLREIHEELDKWHNQQNKQEETGAEGAEEEDMEYSLPVPKVLPPLGKQRRHSATGAMERMRSSRHGDARSRSPSPEPILEP